MVKVAFLVNFKINRWLGGFNLIVNLINSVNKLKNKKIEIVLIVNRSFKIKRLKNLNISIIKSDLFLFAPWIILTIESTIMDIAIGIFFPEGVLED